VPEQAGRAGPGDRSGRRPGHNLTSSSTIAYGERGAIGFLTNDEPGTRSALDEAGIAFREIEAVSFELADTPGTLADASRRLANAGVNIELLVPVAMGGGGITMAAAVDNVPAAQSALGDLVKVST